jgi:hypothetical protein
VGYSNESIVYGTRLLAQVLEIAVVFDHVVGSRSGFFRIDLRLHSRKDVLRVGLIASDNTRDALLERRDDND